jgi:diguanylate cyclase (GGDEF)-like protein
VAALSQPRLEGCAVPRLSDRLTELDAVSPEVAWKLVETLFGQTGPLLMAASVFMVLGVVGFVGTGSPWYLAGFAYTLVVCIWRFWQTRAYAHARDSATPVVWAWRSIRSGCATAAGWGAWSTVVLYEPEQAIVMMVLGMHAGLVAGGAVRNCAVRVAAAGQTLFAAIPLFFACAASDNNYLHVYAGIVALHIVAALTLTKTLHDQTLQLLLKEGEKSDLVARLAAANQDLGVINHQLETLVVTDALTLLANRRAFDLTSAREWQRAAREQIPLSLLLLDIDHFKAFNDFYGHQAGDACLREVASAINSGVHRPGDMLARYGGEEFAVILPGTYLDGAELIAQQICAAVAARALVHEAGAFGHVTISIGAACLVPTQDAAVERLISLADAALYVAKRGGRNRVHAAETSNIAHFGPVAAAAEHI